MAIDRYLYFLSLYLKINLIFQEISFGVISNRSGTSILATLASNSACSNKVVTSVSETSHRFTCSYCLLPLSFLIQISSSCSDDISKYSVGP